MIKILVCAIVGLFWGSFIGAFKDRLNAPKSFLVGRSQCPKCKKNLGFADLIPVFGYIMLGGKCRFCRQPISLYYPILEILCAALAVITCLYFSLTVSSVFLFVSLSFLVLSALADIEDQEVDLALFIIGIVSAVTYLLLSGNSLLNALYGALSYALIPFLLFIVSREKWMGLGDTFFALWAGILVGFPQSIAMIFVAFFLGAMFGIIKLLLSAASHRIAFGPFLAVSAIVGVLCSKSVLDFLQVFLLRR